MKLKGLILVLLITVFSILIFSSCKGDCQHTFGEWEVVKAQTCEEKGVEKRICTLCSHEEERDIAPHTIVVTPGEAPTCTSVGYTESQKCSVCKVVLVEREKIERTPHTPVKAEGKDSTCTAWGQKDGSECSACGAIVTYGDPIPPKDHVLDANNVCTVCKLPYSYSDDLEYTLSEDGTYYTVSGRGTCQDANIIIPDTHLGKPVKKIGTGAFYLDGQVGTVKLGNNVTHIEANAFFCNTAFTYLQLPDSVTYIGANAFDFCNGIKYLDIGSGLEYIDPTAFVRATDIKRIIISDENKSFKVVDDVLYTKDGKTLVLAARVGREEYTVESGTEIIEDYAFYYSKYKTVTLPDSVKEIGTEAFARTEVETLKGGAGLETIGESAFQGSNLSSITLGSKLTAIGKATFNTTKLTSITIPEGITEIPDSCFHGSSNLKSVTIGSKVTKIGNDAFHATGIESLIIPDGVTSIGNYVLAECPALKSVTLGKGINSFNESVFARSGKLAEVKVSADNTAFTSVDGILLTKDGTTIRLYPQGKEKISAPSGVTKIGSGAFYGFTAEEIEIPAGITEVLAGAFNDCPELNKIIIGKDVSVFSSSAITDCRKMVEISVNEDNESFKSVDGILLSKDGKKLIAFPFGKQKVYVPDGVEVICKSAFQDMAFTEITLPDSVKVIEDRAFYFCASLSKITLNDGLTSIGNMAFHYCFALNSIVIPDSVESMGDRAFVYNGPLMTIYAEASEQPEGWHNNWNPNECQVVWGYTAEEN